MKYSTIAKLSLCVLLVPHGNTDPERGFSLNKNVLCRPWLFNKRRNTGSHQNG